MDHSRGSSISLSIVQYCEWLIRLNVKLIRSGYAGYTSYTPCDNDSSSKAKDGSLGLKAIINVPGIMSWITHFTIAPDLILEINPGRATGQLLRLTVNSPDHTLIPPRLKLTCSGHSYIQGNFNFDWLTGSLKPQGPAIITSAWISHGNNCAIIQFTTYTYTYTRWLWACRSPVTSFKTNGLVVDAHRHIYCNSLKNHKNTMLRGSGDIDGHCIFYHWWRQMSLI